MKTNKWLVVVNPAAGGRKAEKDWEQIEGLLFKHKILFEPVFTHRKLHAMVLTKRMIELGFNRIIVVGGDGTMNEVINGVFAQKSIPTNEVKLGIIYVALFH
jgi:diacylglycerol kinase family enzyme